MSELQDPLPPTQTPQPAEPQNRGTSVIGIVSLVLAIVAILGSWIPLLNNISFFIAIVALILGIIAIVSIHKGKKTGKGLVITAIAISALAIVVVLVTQFVFGKALDQVSEELESGPEVAATSSSTASESTETTEGDSATDDGDSQNGGTAATDLAIGDSVTLDSGLRISVDSAEPKTDSIGDDYVFVTISYENTGTEPADFNSFDWRQISPSGSIQDVEWPIIDEGQLESGSLNAGGSVSGIVAVKPDATSISYYGSAFGDTPSATWLLG
ncbi:MAG: DUF4190 domain-containing protein [Actinomycetaceae bacterium]|nr:hypothetical protein [Arcanobacterium sp.]MDD7505434.1 DUF4190 domain-containing protein [Actinomycetaceae bacterium]MDY6142904.1 DUF4190 domain-containing protein [Arcanobacterium sp.]